MLSPALQQMLVTKIATMYHYCPAVAVTGIWDGARIGTWDKIGAWAEIGAGSGIGTWDKIGAWAGIGTRIGAGA